MTNIFICVTSYPAGKSFCNTIPMTLLAMKTALPYISYEKGKRLNICGYEHRFNDYLTKNRITTIISFHKDLIFLMKGNNWSKEILYNSWQIWMSDQLK